MAVPTPVDQNNVPDLDARGQRRRETVGQGAQERRRRRLRVDGLPRRHRGHLRPHPRATSGLKRGARFHARLLPRANQPGRQGAHAREDHQGRVAARTAPTLERVAAAYGAVVDGGRAPRAEHQGRRGREGHREHPARHQHRADERARPHLRSHGHPDRRRARCRWDQVELPPFRPGLVGGHCIGVDPYYLTTKAQQLGYQPEVILAGRRINNSMGPFIAQQSRQAAHRRRHHRARARSVGVLGLTFKENCSDLRNSRVPTSSPSSASSASTRSSTTRSSPPTRRRRSTVCRSRRSRASRASTRSCSR